MQNIKLRVTCPVVSSTETLFIKASGKPILLVCFCAMHSGINTTVLACSIALKIKACKLANCCLVISCWLLLKSFVVSNRSSIMDTAEERTLPMPLNLDNISIFVGINRPYDPSMALEICDFFSALKILVKFFSVK